MSTTNEVSMELQPTGSFTARPDQIGITPEEAIALNRGEPPFERALSIAENMTAAAVSLSTAQILGHC